MKSMKPPGPKSAVALFGLIVLIGFLGGLANGFMADRPGSGAFWATTTLTVVMMVVVLGVAFWWWSRLDEAAREAHKGAWYWGGSLGMLVSIVLMMVLTARAVDIEVPANLGETPIDLFAAGVTLTVGLQLIGYGLAWVWWWLGRR